MSRGNIRPRALRPAPPDPDRDREEIRSTVTAVGIIVALTIFIYLVRDILLPFVFAGILAYVCTPLVDWFAVRTRMPRALFAVAVLLVLMALGTLIGFLGTPALFRELVRVSADLQGTVERLIRQFIGDGTITLLGEPIGATSFASAIVSGVRDWFSQSGRALMVTGWSFAGLFGFILTWVLLGYFLIGARQISDGLFWLVPPRHRSFVHRVWADLNVVLRRYFVGVALVVLYASIIAYIGLGLILHLHHAVFLALLTGMLEVIPIVGPAASAVTAGLVAVQEAQSSWNIMAYVVYATVLRISIDEFFGPIVLGRAAYLQPVLVMFCFLAGGILFGIVGIVLAVPVALTVKATLYELYQEPEAQARAPYRE